MHFTRLPSNRKLSLNFKLVLAPSGEGGSHHVEVREAQTTEGRVLRSPGLDQDTPSVGSEPGAQVFG